MEIAWQIEIDPFCNRVLEKHWPGVKRYGDIKEVDGTELEPVDLICGGPPCQPVSVAGQRRGEEDDRWLWPEALRLVEECKPRWCLFENPPGIINMGLNGILAHLEDQGYETATFDIPACGVDSPQIRHRLWIMAHADSQQINKQLRGPERSYQQRRNPLETGQKASRQENRETGDDDPARLCEGDMAHAGIEGLEGWPGIGRDPEKERQTIERGNGLHMAYTKSGGWHESSSKRTPEYQGEWQRAPGRCNVSECLAHTESERTGRLSMRWPRSQQAEADIDWGGPWSDYEWIIGRDGGKVWRIKSGICGVATGVSHRMDRLRALGNSVVWVIPYILGRMIIQIEGEHH